MSATPAIDDAAVMLEKAVRQRYTEQTREDVERGGNNTVPDFRDHEGMRLQKFGIVVENQCMCSSCLPRLAQEIVDQLLTFERGLVLGAGSYGVKRFFLERCEAPAVFPVIPPGGRYAAPDMIDDPEKFALELRQLRVRHVFGVKQQ